MSEELKNEIIENHAGEETELPAAQEPVTLQVAVPTAVTMWNDIKLMNMSFKMAGKLSESALIPREYQGRPENCLVALDIANRLGMSPLMIMQNLYLVHGKPSWSGTFCAAAVNGCGRFSPLEYVEVGEPGKPSWGYYASAKRLSDGNRCNSEVITMAMASAEGWLNKPGSKWKTMPGQMMRYRAATFFARAYCPDILLGYRTKDEVQDISGYEEEGKQTVVTLNKEGG